MADRGSSSNEAADPEEVGEEALPADAKLCILCGADVSARRRVRQNDGEYICYSCAAERMAEEGKTAARLALYGLPTSAPSPGPLSLGRPVSVPGCADGRALGGGGRRHYERPVRGTRSGCACSGLPLPGG